MPEHDWCRPGAFTIHPELCDMTDDTLPLDDRWKQCLHVQHRLPPDFIENPTAVGDTPYAPAIRIGLQELRLSAVFCVNGVPTVAVRRSHSYHPDTIDTIRSALWNQGLASIYVDITETTNTARIFSLTGKHLPNETDQSKQRGLIETIDATTSAIERLHPYITGTETGRIWQAKKQFFLPEERIDAVMLDNLVISYDRLRTMGLTKVQAQATLIQTMFIAYLEDRGIIDDSYLQSTTNQRYSSWIEVLDAGDYSAMKCLLRALRSDFNGDLFVGSFSLDESAADVELKPNHLHLLMKFRIGKESMNPRGNDQMRFWGYNFHYISIDLISAVYDQFLRQIGPNARTEGAYYTPNLLADTVVTSMWSHLSATQKEAGTFMDPACGSGIFLVKIFQRLCQYKLETSPSRSALQWDDLLQILSRIRGYDKNPAAVQIAAFLLYLALLEQAQHKVSIRLSDQRLKLPSLWKKIVTARSFFDDNYADEQIDVIIGNPPWSSRRHGDSQAVRWCGHNDAPFPQKEIAWAFTWKAVTRLTEGGILAFILPSMAFLHNQTQVAIDARSKLFQNTTVKKVIDFSDLRQMLFPHSKRSATLIVATKRESCPDSSYVFEYLTPKADPNLFMGRSISLTSDDKKWIRSHEVEQKCLVFKHHLHMRAPESALFQYLSTFPTLGDFLRKLSQTPTQLNESLIGQGFRPITGSNSSGESVSSPILSTVPFMPISAFTPIRVDPGHLTLGDFDRVYHLGFENGYSGTRILVPRGIRRKYWRIGAAYVDAPVAFRQIIMAMRVPRREEAATKFVTAILNSRLSIWFALHGTKSFGAGRPEIGMQELVRLPVPFPQDLPDSDASLQVFEKLVQQVDQFAPSGPSGGFDRARICRVLHDIDQLTYRYFGLNDDEKCLVEETVKYVIPAIQPSRRGYPSIWLPPSFEDRRAYSSTLRRRLSGWFTGDQSLSVRMHARNEDYAILETSIASDAANPYSESDSKPFPLAIEELARTLGKPLGMNYCVRPDIRIFIGSKLFTVKPMQKRFWLHAAALADAGAIALDLEVLWHKSRTGGSVS